jgi:hypothetical protein
MFRSACAALLATLLALPSAAAPVTDYKQIEKVMDSIPTAAGVSLKKRLIACKVTVHKDVSSVETLIRPAPEYGAKAGQTVLKLVLDFPPPPKQPGPAKPNPQQKNVTVIWVIDGKKITPVSAWANVLQNRPVPLGYDESNNC